MKPNRHMAITTRIVLFGLACTPLDHALADTIFTLVNNASPSSSFPSTINSMPFDPDTEYRMVSPDGNLGGGPPLQKDIISGTESWSFDTTTNELTGVMNTGTVGNISAETQYSIDASAVAPASCNTGCPALFQSAIYYGGPFDFVAPIMGTTESTANGTATLSLTGASSFKIHFPIFEAHWYGVHFLFGRDNNSGITFNCTGQPTSSYHCLMEHTIQATEDVNNVGFIGWTIQMEFGGAANASVNLGVPAGLLQECNSHNGNTISLNANIATSIGVTVNSIDWLIDGLPSGNGENIQAIVGLGAHDIEVTALMSDGGVAVDTKTVTIVDTRPPTVAPNFFNPFTGQNVTEVNNLFTFLQTNFNVTDACDNAPVAEGVLGKAAIDGEYIWVTAVGEAARMMADTLSLKIIATDASGNVNVGETNLLIYP